MNGMAVRRDECDAEHGFVPVTEFEATSNSCKRIEPSKAKSGRITHLREARKNASGAGIRVETSVGLQRRYFDSLGMY